MNLYTMSYGSFHDWLILFATRLSCLIIGVIESPETLKCIAALFTKTIVWYLLKHSFSPEYVQKKRNNLIVKKDERKYFYRYIRIDDMHLTTLGIGFIIKSFMFLDLDVQKDRSDKNKNSFPEIENVKYPGNFWYLFRYLL